MHLERISEDMFVFTSALYAQVTASVIFTSEGTVVIDTLPFPSESQQVASFVAERSRQPVRYVILTHYHADHVYGAYLFPQAEVVGHALCRELLTSRGPKGLREAKKQTLELGEVSLRLPGLVFEGGEMTLRLGDKSLQLLHAPGHSLDLVAVYAKEDKVLFASDAVMPLPHIVDGDPLVLSQTLRFFQSMNLEMIVQGHGEMILRGEIDAALKGNIKYLDTIQARVARHIAAGKGRDSLADISIESCGKSRIALNGLVQHLHAENITALYERQAG